MEASGPLKNAPAAEGASPVAQPSPRPGPPPRPTAFTILRALKPGTAGEVQQTGTGRPLVSEDQNSLFVKVAFGSWLFAGVGTLLLLIAMFRVV